MAVSVCHNHQRKLEIGVIPLDLCDQLFGFIGNADNENMVCAIIFFSPCIFLSLLSINADAT